MDRAKLTAEAERDFTPIEREFLWQARVRHDFTVDEIFGCSLWDLWMERELDGANLDHR